MSFLKMTPREGGGLVHTVAEEATSALYSWSVKPLSLHNSGYGYFGFVQSGPTALSHKGWSVSLREGMYFMVPDEVIIEGGEGVVISHSDYSPFLTIGGPVEQKGRLKYIDTCSDSLLLSPLKLGDPCLNLLHFPEGVEQTPHTHPSCRIGVVLSGKGTCESWNELEPEVFELNHGDLFTIPAECRHRFCSTSGDELRVLAYHPDSDFGPQDEDHPMINRTLIDGKSASQRSS